jgi:hypothetical protein
MQSIVQNFTNAEQTITVHDPNTHCTVTMLTIPCHLPHQKDDEEVMGFVNRGAHHDRSECNA